MTCNLDAMCDPHMVHVCLSFAMLASKNASIFLLELVCAVAHLRIVLQALETGMGRGMLILRRLGPLNDSCYHMVRAIPMARGWRETAPNSFCIAPGSQGPSY